MCQAIAHKPPCLWPAPGEWADAVERNDQGKKLVDVTEKLTGTPELSEAGPEQRVRAALTGPHSPSGKPARDHLPSSRTLPLGTFPPGSSEGLREKRRARFVVLVLFQTRMPAAKNAKWHSPTDKITELLVLEHARLLPFPLKFNPIQLKHRGSLHEGTDAPENDCGGVFPGREHAPMWRRPHTCFKMKTVPMAMEQLSNTDLHLGAAFS